MNIHISNNIEFDPNEYLIINKDLKHIDKSDAIKHFFCIGISEMRKFSRSISFDPEFYREYYNNTMLGSNEEAYSHWIRKGCIEGKYPNGSALLKAKNIKVERFPHEFFIEAYAQALGISAKNKWYCLEHFIEKGFKEAVFLMAAQAGSDFLKQIAESYIHSDLEKSLQFLELASTKNTDDADLFHTIGDINLNLGRFYNARLAYKNALSKGSNYFWTYINLGISCEKLGLYDEAIMHTKQSCRVQKSSYAAKGQLIDYASKHFYQGLNAATGLSTNLRDIEASNTIKNSINRYLDDINIYVDSTAKRILKSDELKRIAIIGSDSIFQCKLYRIDQKLDQLQSTGIITDYYNLDKSEDLLNKIIFYDAIIIYRAPAVPSIINLLISAKNNNINTFYDIDDLIFDAQCYPPSRDSFGNMITPVEYAGLVTGREMFREAIKLCDFAIASTLPIKHEMEKLVRTGKCYLHRNGLGKLHNLYIRGSDYNSSLEPGKKALTFFYGSGSRSHNENFEVISTALSQILRENSMHKLIIYGPLELDHNFQDLKSQITKMNFSTNIFEYWEVLESCDLNLAPLVNSKFNDGKSEIKWMEAGMLGVPSIVSSTEVYKDIVRDKEDGIIVHNESDWYITLKSIVENENLRLAISQSVKKRVQQEYDLREMGKSLLNILAFNHIPEPKLNKKRILVVNVYYPPQFIGGATRIVENNISYLNKNYPDEFEVEVFCARDSGGVEGSFERYNWDGIAVNSLSPFVDAEHNESSSRTEKFFADFVDTYKPDLIHYHCIQRLTASVIDVARRKYIPYVVTVHDGWWISDRQFLIDEAGVPVYDSNEWGDPRRLSRLKNCLNRASSVMVVSEKFGDLYKSRGIKNVTVCANGASILNDISAPPQSSPIYLGLLGGLGIAKGADLLYDVLSVRKFENLKFLIVDHSALEGTLQKKYWGENEVEIVGKSSFHTVYKIYEKIHFLLAISVCVESFGLVAREATLLGKWVIASNRGGISEDIQEGINGFVVDVSSIEPLINLFEMINSNPEKYCMPHLGEKPSRTPDDNSRDVVEVYRQTLFHWRNNLN